MRPSTDDGVSCDLCFSVVLPALAKLRSDEVLVAGMVKINLASADSFGHVFSLPCQYSSKSFGKHMSPLPRVYRSLCSHSRGITVAAIPIPAELPQQSSPLPR